MQERMTLANMSAELGAQTALIAPDRITADFLAEAGARDVDIVAWQGDTDAPVLATHSFDAATLAPQIAAPFSPANAAAAADYDERIDIAYIGACTGAKLTDLRAAAQVLKGRKIAAGVEFMVGPASKQDQDRAQADGTLQILLDAGARLLPTACGACAGYGENRFGENTNVISSTARNFKGRMGAASSRVFLGSPYSVAAAAVQGRICDPRELLA
jgi:3-isopropylmalate/(R)-2-methylmalate dehydratase large subunit